MVDDHPDYAFTFRMVGEFPVLVFPHVVLTIVPTTVVSRAGKVWLKNKKKTAFSSPQTHEPAIEKKLTDMAESPYFTDDGLEPATVLGISTVLRTFPDKPVFGISQDYLLCVSSAFATASSLLRERAADSVSNSSSSSGSNSGSVSTKSASGDGKKRKLADDDEAADITEEAHGASRASNGESARKRAKGSGTQIQKHYSGLEAV